MWDETRKGLIFFTEPKLQFHVLLLLKSAIHMHFIDEIITYIDFRLLKNCYHKLITMLVY
ncbi:MAG: hypothetical protein RLZ77_752 [Bacteroidota bacterium]|jgi:hypothetical protein